MFLLLSGIIPDDAGTYLDSDLEDRIQVGRLHEQISAIGWTT